MTINITGRKTTIKDSFREEAEREMTRFDRLFDDDASAHILSLIHISEPTRH